MAGANGKQEEILQFVEGLDVANSKKYLSAFWKKRKMVTREY